MKNLKKAVKFLKEIKGTTGIFFHRDTDGACSAAQMIKYLKTKKINPELFCGGYDKHNMTEFLKNKFDNYIFVDIFPVEFPEVQKLMKGKKILIIDHHPSKDMSGKEIVHVNPRFDKPDVYISASEICYKVLNKTVDFSKNEWIARLGGVGDRSIEGSEKEVEASDIVDAVRTLKKLKGLITVAKFLVNSKKLDDLLYEDRFWKMREQIKGEIEKRIMDYELTAHGKITFFEMRGKYGLTSIVINKVFELYPKRTIIFYRKVSEGWKISARSFKHNLSKIFTKASKGIGNAAGHPQAAGGLVTDIELFKKRCLKLMK